MKQLRGWLGSIFVPLLAVLSLLVVAGSVYLDIRHGLRLPGEYPVLYDLAIAFLMGVFFQYLVVYLPQQRRTRQTIEAHRGRLRMVANTGPDLLRELEFVAQCPPRELTDEHLRRVLTATNENRQVQALVRDRLNIAHQQYRSLLPFLFSLPHDVVVALERVEQSQLNVFFRHRFDAQGDPVLQDRISPLRERREVLKTDEDGGHYFERKTLVDFFELFQEFRDACAQLETAIQPHLDKPSRYRAYERVTLLNYARLESPGEPHDYPEEAFSVEWAGDPPPLPPHMEVQFKRSPPERRPD
ncbi:hypothetical protein [Agrococcus terreus]|uniref:Uncharacterized protein n=1 Tax=Agrococcus terreus TaxID=574649 RepID=A0ABQ2KHS3_9MICO|nr:hypothetical protein [Agrococcus terreus]GGN82350.1 hypothetical protein GCM10010968_12060 [Agrococcus terreus]